MDVLRGLARSVLGRFGPSPSPDRWLFVVGCYNSGTTLLHDLLALHPSIGSLPTEGQFLTDQLVVPARVGLPRLWALRPDDFRLTEAEGSARMAQRMRRQWRRHFDDADRPVLMERSPPNAARTRWLQAHFPPATFVGIVRDGHAVAEGIRRRAGHSVADGARQWAISNEVMLGDFAHLERRLLVRYEELTEDPDAVVGGILEFLDLDGLSSSLRDRRVSVHGATAPVRNMNDRSLAALSTADIAAIRAEAGGMLRRLGYL